MSSPLYCSISLALFFLCFSVCLLVINVVYVVVISIQPQFNHYLNELIAEIRKEPSTWGILKICLIFGSFKSFTSLVSITHDVSMEFLGVRIYSFMTSLVIRYCEGNSRQNGNLITLIE